MIKVIQPFNKQQPLLIYLHLPKTGGTTLKKIIKNNYRKSKTVDVYVDREKLENTLTHLSNKKISCIQGHMPFGVHDYFKRPCSYITMMREPIDRILSEYYFIRNTPHHNLHSKVTEISLEEYQNEPNNFNLQTHLILGNKFGKELLKEDLEKAKSNLAHYFAVVGITERFNESIFLMKQKLGWNNLNYKKANITKNRLYKEEIPKKIIDQIAKNNEVDIELYHFAKELLEKKINLLNIK
ncbi:sulfotransferase family 2 domain-containing protein [Metabacillus fastidiosus]|uniref:sulfotransferase family 2 domain-containing protein n=1 Tax=Metabacillus fastidiosus TaxID=1458 RepID=UPI003D281BB6